MSWIVVKVFPSSPDPGSLWFRQGSCTGEPNGSLANKTEYPTNPAEWMNAVEIRSGSCLMGDVALGGSKSITNRALVCAAAAAGDSHLVNPGLSQDALACARS